MNELDANDQRELEELFDYLVELIKKDKAKEKGEVA